jgi:hypothetical protein
MSGPDDLDEASVSEIELDVMDALLTFIEDVSPVDDYLPSYEDEYEFRAGANALQANAIQANAQEADAPHSRPILKKDVILQFHGNNNLHFGVSRTWALTTKPNSKSFGTRGGVVLRRHAV